MGKWISRKKAHHSSFNSSQEPVGWVPQKRTDYGIWLFSCIYLPFIFFSYQEKENKQRKIIFSFALGLKKSSRDLIYKGPSLWIKTESTVQIERFFENLLPQLHKRKKTKLICELMPGQFHPCSHPCSQLLSGPWFGHSQILKLVIFCLRMVFGISKVSVVTSRSSLSLFFHFTNEKT